MKVSLFNPLDTDFVTTYDINEDGNPPTFVLHAGEIEPFDKPIADHIKHHLAQKIAFATRQGGNYDEAYRKAVKRIEVQEL